MYVEEDVQVEYDDSPELLDFLNKVVPKMCNELEKNANSTALNEVSVWGNEAADLSVTYTLYGKSAEDIFLHLSALCVSWNVTGSNIAVGFGAMEHEDWCAHRAGACLWNLDRRDFETNKPDSVLETTSCTMSVAFHQSVPGLLLGGCFSGEVLVWDLSRDQGDPLLASSAVADFGHKEPVNEVMWVASARTRHNRLISVGGDGLLLLWNLDRRKGRLNLEKRFCVSAADLPRSVRGHHDPRGLKKKEVTLTCGGTSPSESHVLVLASDSGVVFRAELGSLDNLPPPDDFTFDPIETPSPVTLSFVAQSSPLLSLELSSHARGMYLVCGGSGRVDIFTALQSSPVLGLEPGYGSVTAARFSPARPGVLAVVCESGHLLIYDLVKSTTLPVHTVFPEMLAGIGQEGRVTPITSLQFNAKDTSLLACGDSRGRVYIVKLNEDLRRSVLADQTVISKLTELKK